MKKINLKIKGMHCKSCEIIITDSLTETKGIEKTEISHEKGNATITFDETKTNEKEIRKIIKDEGYEVE